MIPNPKELREKFLTDQNGVVQQSIKTVSEFLTKNYRPGKGMTPPMPTDREAAEAVANAFRNGGWHVEYFAGDQRDGSYWIFKESATIRPDYDR